MGVVKSISDLLQKLMKNRTIEPNSSIRLSRSTNSPKKEAFCVILLEKKVYTLAYFKTNFDLFIIYTCREPQSNK